VEDGLALLRVEAFEELLRRLGGFLGLGPSG
jgi:hypothetical protein